MWILVAIYIVVFGSLAVRRHTTHNSFSLDLGIMSQVTWNTANGRPFETSLGRAQYDELLGSYLGNHVRPVLLALAPLYRLWPDPRLLLTIQTVCLGLGALPLYWIAHTDVDSEPARVTLVVTYLLYPALGFLNLFDFHPVAFCVPAFLLAFWALRNDRSGLFWVMILVCLSTKEELVVPVAAFGVYCLAHRDWRREGLLTLMLATVWTVACFFVIVPRYNEGRPYRFLKLWAHVFPMVGESTSWALHKILVPAVSPDVGMFLLHLLLPLGFLPLFAPKVFAVALPTLAYLITSSRPTLYQIGVQYPAVIVPWLFLATSKALSRMKGLRWQVSWARRWLPVSILIVGTVGANLMWNPVHVSSRSRYFHAWEHRQDIQEALDRIPPDAGVATINSLGPQLSNRRVLIALINYGRSLRWDHLGQADYVLLDLVDCRGMLSDDPRRDYAEIVHGILDMELFRVDYWEGRVLLLKRDEEGVSKRSTTAVKAYVSELVKQNRPCWP